MPKSKYIYKPSGLTALQKLFIIAVALGALYLAAAISAGNFNLEPVGDQLLNWAINTGLWVFNNILQPFANWITSKF